MLKDKLLEQLDNSNHYTIPKYVLSFAKELELDCTSLMLLIYFLNMKNKEIFNYENIIKDLNVTDKELMEGLSKLQEKRLLVTLLEKNENGLMEEKIDISPFYDVILSKMLEEKKEEKSTIYDVFEKELGRTLSPLEYDIIGTWLTSGIKEEVIQEALKEAVFNGVNSFKYIDKILFEWNKKGIKKKEDVKKAEKKQEEEKEETSSFDFEWLGE